MLLCECGCYRKGEGTAIPGVPWGEYSRMCSDTHHERLLIAEGHHPPPGWVLAARHDGYYYAMPETEAAKGGAMGEVHLRCECGDCGGARTPSTDWDEYHDRTTDTGWLILLDGHHKDGWVVAEQHDGYHYAKKETRKEKHLLVCECKGGGCGKDTVSRDWDEYREMRRRGYLIVADGHHAPGGVVTEQRKGYHFEVTADSLARRH